MREHRSIAERGERALALTRSEIEQPIEGWRRKPGIASSDGSGLNFAALAWGLRFEQLHGACPTLHPRCSERGVRINMIQLRKQMQNMIFV